MGLAILDRYVLRSWIRIFVLTALGFPVVSVLIKITDNMRRLLSTGLTVTDIVVSYGYVLPEEISMVMELPIT